MSLTEINIAISCPFSEKKIIKAVELVKKMERKTKGLVEINIVGDSFIKNINKQYRGFDKVTDVLSFAWQESGGNFSAGWLGQIFISYPQIKRQAKEYGVTVGEEFARMLAHGLLHLAGYDHQIKKDEVNMFKKQEKITAKIKDLFV